MDTTTTEKQRTFKEYDRIEEHYPALKQSDAPQVPLHKIKNFTGDGSHTLQVPGCTYVDAIQVDGIEVPPYRDDTVLKNEQEKEVIRIPNWDCIVIGGVPTIIRSMISNFGKWQKGSTVTVIGDWEDQPAPDDESHYHLYTPEHIEGSPVNTEQTAATDTETH